MEWVLWFDASLLTPEAQAVLKADSNVGGNKTEDAEHLNNARST